MRYEKSRCKTCKDIISQGDTYCDFCSKLYFKDKEYKTVRNRYTKEKEKRKSEPYKPRACACCKLDYIPCTPKQKYCSDSCRPKPKTEAEKWIDKKPHISNGMDSNQVEYSFFRKKYCVSTKFKVVRG